MRYRNVKWIQKFLLVGPDFFLSKNPIFQEIKNFFPRYDEYDDQKLHTFFTFFPPIFQEIKRSKICSVKSDRFKNPIFQEINFFFFQKNASKVVKKLYSKKWPNFYGCKNPIFQEIKNVFFPQKCFQSGQKFVQ